MKRRADVIFSVCFLAYLLIYTARLNLSMAAPELRSLAVLTTQQIGVLGGMFSVVYACGRLLSGRIADRTAPWKLICLGLALCGLSNLCAGLLPPFPAFLLLWGVNAFAQSLLWGPILRMMSAIYPEQAARQRASWHTGAVAAGSIVSILLSARLIGAWGAPGAFLVPGALVLAVAPAMFLLTRAIRPQTPPQARSAGPVRRKDVLRMLPPALIHGVMKDNVSLWMTVYVMDRFGTDLESSSGFILLIPLLGLVGRFLAPGLHRLCRSREAPLMALSFLCCAVSAAALALLPLRVWSAVLLLSLIYMATSVINSCLLAIFPLRFAQDGHVAAVSGIMDFAAYLSMGLSAMIYGAVIHAHGYVPMYLSWAILSALALMLLVCRRGRPANSSEPGGHL